MDREELERSRAVARRHMEAARRELPGTVSLERLDKRLSGNELELALEELEAIGAQASAGLRFWESVLAAAANMFPSEQARLVQDRVIGRVREARKQGWTIPAELRRQDENVYVFPWPGRDEAFMLFDIESLGPAGPEAGSLALLRGWYAPEIVWQSGPFVVYLDEYWLGPAHSVTFSDGVEYAFTRPYLRGRFRSSFLVLVRASDSRCAILETGFTVYRVEAAAAGSLRAHAIPDPRTRILRDDEARRLDHAPSRLIRESDLAWFEGTALADRVEEVQSRAT